MFFNPETHGQLAQERIEREIATAGLLRQARPPAIQPDRPSAERSATGSSRFGARLAAEPSLESARSR